MNVRRPGLHIALVATLVVSMACRKQGPVLSVPEVPATPTRAAPADPPVLPEAAVVPRVDEETRAALLERLVTVEALLAKLDRRALSEGQRELLSSSRGFADQARGALDAGDLRRAEILIDKAHVLTSEIESDTGD